MIFSKKCDIIPLGKSHKSLEMQKNLVQNSGTRWYFSCIVYIFSADDIFRKVAENPEKSTILANILRYLQIYIPAGPHWGGRGRKFKFCHSDQIRTIILIRYIVILTYYSQNVNCILLQNQTECVHSRYFELLKIDIYHMPRN